MTTEKRLIDVRDLWSDIMMLPHNGDMISSEEVEQAIKEAETVDAVEVVRGRWINKTQVIHGQVDYMFVCSSCGNIYWDSITDSFDYCPQCGAKMDGDGNG